MRAWRGICLLLTVLVLAGLLSAPSGAQQPAKNQQPEKKPGRGNANGKREGKVRPPITVTPEREAAVLTFIQRNHAELADLLAHLKDNQPAEYEQAVKEIFRVTERLAQIQERDPLQYELEIAVWTAQSRVQLLSARMKMAVTDDLKQELRQALGVQSDARLTLLKHERQKAADRLGKLEADISRFETERERVIDRQMQLLTRAAEGRVKPGAKANANAGKRAKEPAKTTPAP
jgi:hypothetical protein